MNSIVASHNAHSANGQNVREGGRRNSCLLANGHRDYRSLCEMPQNEWHDILALISAVAAICIVVKHTNRARGACSRSVESKVWLCDWRIPAQAATGVSYNPRQCFRHDQTQIQSSMFRTCTYCGREFHDCPFKTRNALKVADGGAGCDATARPKNREL